MKKHVLLQVSSKHFRVLSKLWATYPVRLPSHLLKLSKNFKRYASAKRSYLVLRQVLRLRPRKGCYVTSSTDSSLDSSSTDIEAEEEFPCRHGDPFKVRRSTAKRGLRISFMLSEEQATRPQASSNYQQTHEAIRPEIKKLQIII